MRLVLSADIATEYRSVPWMSEFFHVSVFCLVFFNGCYILCQETQDLKTDAQTKPVFVSFIVKDTDLRFQIKNSSQGVEMGQQCLVKLKGGLNVGKTDSVDSSRQCSMS